MLIADQLLERVAAALDDSARIHTTQAQSLRALSRASQWVSVRYRLLRHAFPLSLEASVPLYDRLTIAPSAVTLLSASLGGTPVYPTPLTALRYRDPQWLKTSGTPSLIYCVRWRLWGVYPVPVSQATLLVTCLVAAQPLTLPTQALEVPEGYGDQVVHVATGLLMITRERALQQGLERIKIGLELTQDQARTLVARAA